MIVEHVLAIKNGSTVADIVWETNSVKVTTDLMSHTETFEHCEDAREHAHRIISEYRDNGNEVHYL